MKNLTKSDLINIEALKGALKMLSNNIKDIKASKAAASEKAKQLMAVYRHRAQLINQGNSKYPHINWIDEAIGEDNSFNRSLIDTARMKAEQIAVFNYNNRVNLN